MVLIWVADGTSAKTICSASSMRVIFEMIIAVCAAQAAEGHWTMPPTGEPLPPDDAPLAPEPPLPLMATVPVPAFTPDMAGVPLEAPDTAPVEGETVPLAAMPLGATVPLVVPAPELPLPGLPAPDEGLPPELVPV